MEKCEKCGKQILVDMKGGQKWNIPKAGILAITPHKCKLVSPRAEQTVGAAPVKYSVAEIEKLFSICSKEDELRNDEMVEGTAKYFDTMDYVELGYVKSDFLNLLKDQKKVEAILNEK